MTACVSMSHFAGQAASDLATLGLQPIRQARDNAPFARLDPIG